MLVLKFICFMRIDIYIRLILLLLFFNINTQNLFTQNACSFIIKGKVLDLDNGAELDGTFITIQQTGKTYIANSHGDFKTDELCEGIYTLVIQHVGCKDTTLNVTVNKSLIKLQIKLPHSAVELSEIDVIDKQKEIQTIQAVSTLNSKELDKIRGQSLGESLKQINGVTSLNAGSTISKPMIHGMQGYRVLILNNGIRQEGQQWGNEHAPEIDPFISNNITVVKGASSVKYGSDAMAGVVLVEPDKLPDTVALTGVLNVVGITNGRAGIVSGMLQGNFEKLKGLSWRVQGTYKKSGNIKTPNYYLKNTAIEESNFSYAIGYHKNRWGIDAYYSQFNSKIGIFTGAHIGNLTDLKAAFNLSKPQDSLANFSYQIERPRQEISHELAKAKFHWHLTPRVLLNIQYAMQYNIRNEFDKNPPRSTYTVNTNKPDLDYRITTQTADVFVEHLNIKSFRGQFGGSFMNQKNVYLGRFLIPNFLNNTFGIFAIERYVKQHFEIEAGIRYDYKNLKSFYYTGNILNKPDLHFSNISWNVGYIYKPNSNFNILLNASSAWRSPAPNELYSNGLHQGLGSIERGNASLKPEQVYNLSTTAMYHSKLFVAEITAYHNQFKNYIYLNPQTQPELTIKGAYPVFNYMQSDVRISGLDMKADVNITKFLTVIPKAMFLRAWNYNAKDYLVYMPSDRYSIDVKLSGTISKNINESFIQIGYQYITKQWRVPKNTDFSNPPNGYGLFGFYAGTNLVFGKQTIIVVLSATNVLNTTYRDYLDRFRYFADSPSSSYSLILKVPFTLYQKKHTYNSHIH